MKGFRTFIIRASYENRKGSASYENTGSKNLDWLENLKKYKDQKIVVIYSYDSKYFWKIAKIITLLSKKSSMYRTRKYFIINKTKPNGFPNSLA